MHAHAMVAWSIILTRSMDQSRQAQYTTSKASSTQEESRVKQETTLSPSQKKKKKTTLSGPSLDA